MVEKAQQAVESQSEGHTADALPDLTGVIRWRLVGPHRGGRVVAVAADPIQPMVFYFGACAGGVWNTVDGGAYWENISDGFFRTAAVGAIAVSEADPNVIYVGTGETTIRGNVSHGDGVYKSTDGGKTWRNVGLVATRHIAKIRIHPQNPDLVYVAALGHAWGSNAERGIYRSRDGGVTWEQVLFRSERAGAIDLSMNPRNPRILYASFWQAQRRPYSLESGGPGSSIYRSNDGGDTWVGLTNKEGLPKGVKGKIGIAVSAAKSDRVWALVEAEDGALFRSDDGGETWQRLSEDAELRRRAWYYSHIVADPVDAETVWVLNVKLLRSIDGGKTFAEQAIPHGDNHDLWIDPRNPQRMIQGNDGGACVTFNGGFSWSSLYNQPTAQMYHVTIDNQVPYRLYGSQQDNTAISLPSFSSRGAITTADWFEPGGGESGYIAVQPDDPNIVYGGGIGSGSFNGRLLRYDHRTGQEHNITVWPEEMGMGDSALDLRFRFQWTFPIEISPHDPTVLHVGANKVLRSIDRGASWEVISPDLSRNDTATLGPSGGPITKDNTGAEVYGTIFAFAESPHEQGVFWAGSDDGLVHLSRDGGTTWQNVTPPALPEWALISVIEVSPHDPAGAYLAATRYKHNDWQPYLFKTKDYGKTWQTISNDLPEHDFTRVVRADPAQAGLLYAGSETGVYVSFDDGISWQGLQGNLPVVPIHDLVVKNLDLVAATHGRSFWILDDLSPLHQIAAERTFSAPRLFAPRATTRLRSYKGYGMRGSETVEYRFAGPLVSAYRRRLESDGSKSEVLLDAGANPPNGVIVSYYLPTPSEGEVQLRFLNAAGTEIRQFSSKASAAREHADGTTEADEAADAEHEEKCKVQATAGFHRFVWDMRYERPHKVPGDKSTEHWLIGPLASPGRYRVVLEIGEQQESQEFAIYRDPRTQATQEDLDAQCQLLLLIRDKLSQTHDAINGLRDLRQQLKGWKRRAERVSGGEALKEPVEASLATLRSIEDALIQVKADSALCYPSRLNEKLAALIDAVGNADMAPTKQSQAVFSSLCEQIDGQLARLRVVTEEDLAQINTLVRDGAIPAVIAQAEATTPMP